LVTVDINDGIPRIGTIECILSVDDREFFGINLLEPVLNGGNGKWNNIRHFTSPQGHGLFIRKSHIIRKISFQHFMLAMQQTLTKSRRRFNEFAKELSDRDERIKKLKNDNRTLQKLLQLDSNKKETPKLSMPSLSKSRKSFKMKKKYKQKSQNKNVPSRSYETNDAVYNVSLFSPPPTPCTQSPSDNNHFPNMEPMKNNKNLFHIEKHSEYSKYSDIKDFIQLSGDDDETFWNKQTLNDYNVQPSPSLSPFLMEYSPEVQQRECYKKYNKVKRPRVNKKYKSVPTQSNDNYDCYIPLKLQQKAFTR